MAVFPRSLTPVTGPFLEAKLRGVAEGMGTYGESTRALLAEGLLSPDLVTGMTLALLARQPRRPRPPGQEKASGVAGGVWVRERFTVHRPQSSDDAWVVEGESTGTYARKGRSYSNTTSRTRSSAGDLFATNLTTGLFSYRPDPNLADSVQGLAIEDTPVPGPDWEAAANNPAAGRIARAGVGQVLGGQQVAMTLAMMAARDTDNPDNPIHSDLDQAKKAGLARPIAGGSHVAAFALEAVMQAFGRQSLLHGACFDFRWKAPTEDDTRILPTATVTAVETDRVELDLQVDLVDGPTAMVGRLVIPLAA